MAHQNCHRHCGGGCCKNYGTQKGSATAQPDCCRHWCQSPLCGLPQQAGSRLDKVGRLGKTKVQGMLHQVHGCQTNHCYSYFICHGEIGTTHDDFEQKGQQVYYKVLHQKDDYNYETNQQDNPKDVKTHGHQQTHSRRQRHKDRRCGLFRHSSIQPYHRSQITVRIQVSLNSSRCDTRRNRPITSNPPHFPHAIHYSTRRSYGHRTSLHSGRKGTYISQKWTASGTSLLQCPSQRRDVHFAFSVPPRCRNVHCTHRQSSKH